MKPLRHAQHRNLYASLDSDFWNFELSVWLHTIGRSLISIFIPILMLRFGYRLSDVLLYYIFLNAFDVPLNFVAYHLTILWGAKKIIIIATLAAIFYFVLFHQLVTGSLFVLLGLAFLDALYDAFYWVAHLYLFYESTSTAAHAGQETGIISSVRSFASMVGPLVGALILVFGNQTFLLAMSILFFSISIVPLLRLHHIKDKPDPRAVSLRGFFSELRERRDFLSLFFNSMHGPTENVLWPIFIFLFFGTIKSIALVAVVVSVGKVIFCYLTGLIARKNRNILILIGSLMTIVIWIGRFIYPNTVFYYLSIFLAGFFIIMIEIPLDSNITERTEEKGSLAASTYRNATSMFGQLILFVLLALFVEVFKLNFILAVATLLALILVNRFSPYLALARS